MEVKEPVCSRCGKPTLPRELSAYGGMCEDCSMLPMEKYVPNTGAAKHGNVSLGNLTAGGGNHRKKPPK